MSILRYQACSDPGRTGPIVNKEYLAFSTKSHGNRCFVCDSMGSFTYYVISCGGGGGGFQMITLV